MQFSSKMQHQFKYHFAQYLLVLRLLVVRRRHYFQYIDQKTKIRDAEKGLSSSMFPVKSNERGSDFP